MNRRERGAGSVLVLVVTMLIVAALLVATTVGSGFAARHRAAAAADLAALAAAGQISATGGGDPCAAAQRVSHANGADLRECVVAGMQVEVAAAVAVSGPLRWLADPVRRARAALTPTVRIGVVAAGEWLVPVAGPYRLTARFGDTGPHWAAGTHTGLDFAAPPGTPVVASSGGRVIQAGRAGPYGNLVVIGHDGGVATYYAHLSTIGVAAQDDVGAGHHIGTVGATGNATGPHLHFEVRVDGAARNPGNFLFP